ncbi:MAG: ABC transporter ATP-binding protein/permease [Cryomorphaceae bacterium]|nr:ABC transporter ATP-binding protein/permease [Cryomorphaceae bacterium]
MSEKASINLSVFKRLVAHIRPYKGIFALAVTFTLVLAIIGPARPMIIGRMVDNYVVKTNDSERLLFWSGIVVLMLVLEGVIQFANAYFSNLLAQNIIRDLRQKLFAHMLSFRMRFFDKTPIGTLVTRVVSDLEAITEVFSAGLMEITGDMLSLVAVISMMLYVNWKLTLLTLIPVPLLIIATRIFARAMRSSFQLERVQVNKLNTFVQEHVTGMGIVQLFNREEKEYEAFQEINKGHRQAHINAVWANSIFFPVVELLSSMSIAFLLVWGAMITLNRTGADARLVYGEIISFTLWVQMLYRPIRQLADKFNVLQRGTVRAERVFETLDLQEDVQDSGNVTSCDFNKQIKFEGVSFAYTDENRVLKDLNFTIEKGETVAFVGATGSGKSTIVNLLGKFYELRKGKISIGEVDLKDIRLDILRKNISVVLQDVFLFSDTIHNNITLGDPDISREQVIAAAKAVGAHEFIGRLPEGYDYVVGERGGVLSTGQRQLIAFIRASVYNPQILILDEATSSIDSESEELIIRATERLTEGRTSIVIAHRLSTIQNADSIIVLDKGKIVESGKHNELVSLGGYYANLYKKQFNEEKDDI